MMPKNTFDLIQLAQHGDKQAAELLVEENAGLVWSVVRRFFGRGIDADDLYQLGCVGFLKAIHGFDPNYGTQFSTYAVPKISGEIRRFLRDDGVVKVSRGLKERAQQLRLARGELEQKLGRDPSLSELSEHTGISLEDIALAENSAIPTESLQRESGEENFTLAHVLGDYGQEERLVERLALEEAIHQLSEREQMVIALRFYRGMTQDKAAKILQVSQVQISRLERKAVESLRRIMS